ncbi:MAG: hypothetical protein IJT65_06515 [Eubacterium sp.]|nr:hypothetical protein [Eubacterium sp.]
MKRALILFIILFISTVIIPFCAVVEKNKTDKTNEVVTIFNAEAHGSIPFSLQ